MVGRLPPDDCDLQDGWRNIAIAQVIRAEGPVLGLVVILAVIAVQSVNSDVKPPNMRAGLLMLLLSIALTATAQQNKPWQSKPCKEHPGWCGILVTFNPPIDEALLVPNEVTVDVPLELQASKVVVSSYPLGTNVADIPGEILAVTSRFQKVGKYARFRGEIKQCPEQGGLTVDVFVRKFERYPITPYGMAVECRQIVPKAAR